MSTGDAVPAEVAELSRCIESEDCPAALHVHGCPHDPTVNLFDADPLLRPFEELRAARREIRHLTEERDAARKAVDALQARIDAGLGLMEPNPLRDPEQDHVVRAVLLGMTYAAYCGDPED
jgi:hypothetical protein